MFDIPKEYSYVASIKPTPAVNITNNTITGNEANIMKIVNCTCVAIITANRMIRDSRMITKFDITVANAYKYLGTYTDFQNAGITYY